jgi:hypothetical protein
MILHLNTKYTQMGSSSLPTLRITQNKFNKIKWNHKSQGIQRELKQTNLLARDKAIESNRQCKDDQYIYHMIKYQLYKDKRYLDLFPGGILQKNSRSSSQERSIWKRIRIKHHTKEDILDILK